MPQLDLYGAPVAHQLDVTYRLDPLHPDRPARLLVIIGRGKGTVVEAGGWDVPRNVVHELVADAFSEAWQGYLFGEPGDAVKSAGHAVKRWRAESLQRPAW